MIHNKLQLDQILIIKHFQHQLHKFLLINLLIHYQIFIDYFVMINKDKLKYKIYIII